MQYSNSIEAHKVQLEKYLVREGAGLDGERPGLFGTDPAVYQASMVGKNFRVFLSPESPDVDIKKLGEDFIRNLEQQTGYRFYWQGACHYNTAHPHTHLLINGVDKNGREVKFPKDIVKTFMREAARGLCTTQLGERTMEELEIEREKELSAPRWIKLDNHIHTICSGLNFIRPGAITFDRKRTLVRLESLRLHGLCSYVNGEYVFRKNWDEDLKNNSRYNCFLKARGELLHSEPSALCLYNGEQGQITGKVTKIYRPDDDASDNHVVVIESPDGRAYFIPLLKKPEMYDLGKKTIAEDGKIKLGKSPLAEGEIITVKTYQTQRGRLTPVFLKQDIKSMQKEMQKGNYPGRPTSATAQGKGAIHERQSK